MENILVINFSSFPNRVNAVLSSFSKDERDRGMGDESSDTTRRDKENI